MNARTRPPLHVLHSSNGSSLSPSGRAASARLVPEHGVISPDDFVALTRHRRRVRLIRFLICESVALALLFCSVVAGLSVRFAEESLTPLFRVLPIAAAALATIIPVLFFGSPKRRRPWHG